VLPNRFINDVAHCAARSETAGRFVARTMDFSGRECASQCGSINQHRQCILRITDSATEAGQLVSAIQVIARHKGKRNWQPFTAP